MEILTFLQERWYSLPVAMLLLNQLTSLLHWVAVKIDDSPNAALYPLIPIVNFFDELIGSVLFLRNPIWLLIADAFKLTAKSKGTIWFVEKMYLILLGLALCGFTFFL